MMETRPEGETGNIIRISVLPLLFFIFLLFDGSVCPAHADFDIGSPVLLDLWVDPVNGSEDNSGLSRADALGSISSALGRIPAGAGSSETGFRIMLVAGDYPQSSLPSGGWIESLRGTYTHPVIIRAADGPHSVRIHGYLNIFDSSHLYLMDLDLVTDPGYGGGGNVIHVSNSDNVLIRSCSLNGFDGSVLQSQETLKMNQVQYVYVEDSDISGAFWFPLDFVSVQYGHIIRSRIHNSGDDCLLLKGGTAHITVEGNEIYDCGVTGFAAGQGTGFEYMVAPWLHYEVYDLKFVNNVLHDIVNAGIAVRGGYNILVAYNSLYTIGYDPRGSGLLLLSQGARTCDGDAAACRERNIAGGWGPVNVGEGMEWIPNRNVYIYNNVFFNPSPVQTSGSHITVFGPVYPPAGTNIPSPSYADTNVQIKGNVIWNGPDGHPLGIEDTDQGCGPSNPSCNAAQLRADNWINVAAPMFMNASVFNFHPLAGGNLFEAAAHELPDFTWTGLPVYPPVPQGNLSNSVVFDRDLNQRRSAGPAGAYSLTLCSDAAVLSQDFDLYVPLLNFSNYFYSADFSLVAGTIDFELAGAGVLPDASTATDCAASVLSSSLRLHLPALNYYGISLWADFRYREGLRFTLVDAGYN